MNDNNNTILKRLFRNPLQFFKAGSTTNCSLGDTTRRMDHKSDMNISTEQIGSKNTSLCIPNHSFSSMEEWQHKKTRNSLYREFANRRKIHRRKIDSVGGRSNCDSPSALSGIAHNNEDLVRAIESLSFAIDRKWSIPEDEILSPHEKEMSQTPIQDKACKDDMCTVRYHRDYILVK